MEETDLRFANLIFTYGGGEGDTSTYTHSQKKTVPTKFIDVGLYMQIKPFRIF